MVRKFIQAQAQGQQALNTDTVPDTVDWENFQEFYFFYGTLMDHATLANILKHPGRPELHPAKIMGYSIKLWGDYPALLDGSLGNLVHGMAHKVKSQAEVDRLIVYETDG